MKKHARKLQFTGKSTYIVSLPKKWVLEHGLKAGSTVVVEERGSVLLIKPGEHLKEEPKRLTIVVNENTPPEVYARYVIGAYLVGYDEVYLRGSITPALRNTIRAIILTKLLAAEIVSEDASEIQIKIVLSYNNIGIKEAMRRLAKITVSTLHDACKALSTRDPAVAEEVAKEDDSVDRAYFFVNRLISLAVTREAGVEELSPLDPLFYRSASKLLERIGDHAANIALHSKQVEDVPSEVSALCNEVVELVKSSSEALLSKNPMHVQKISSIVDYIKEAEERIMRSFMEKASPAQLIPLKMILESIRRIAEYSKDIAELALDLGIERVGVSD